MDLLQLPRTKKGNKYLLVFVDILTRYATAVPLSDKSSKQVTSALKRQILRNPLLGPPAIFVSDNGLEFANQAMKRLLGRYGVKQASTAHTTRKATVPQKDSTGRSWQS